MEITRIFDLLPYIKETYKPYKDILAKKVNKEWKSYSIDEYIEHANTLSYAFLNLGVKKGDKIAIISSNRPEWNFLDMGIQQIGAIPIPIYPTISASEYHYILNHSGVKYIFSEGAELLAKLEPILSDVPSIEELFTFVDRGTYRFLDNLYEIGRANPQPELLEKIKSEISPEDVATILFTSGTTGVSKGVMLTHNNIVGNMKGLRDIPQAGAGAVTLSFLPLCHIYERTINYVYHYKGYRIYYAENAGTVAQNAQEIKPEVIVSVPRILEKIYDKIFVSGENLPFFKKRIYYWAMDLALHYDLENRTWLYNLQHRIADRLVYKKFRDILGGQLKTIISGGAALQERLGRFFAGVGFPFVEGYGLTETSPVISVGRFEKGGRKFGCVGLVMEGLEVKIADDDEILCKGYSIMKGYYNNPEETAKAIDKDGFFHTGDLGRFEGKHLKITGRKKSLFKTSFGKFVNPLLIEDKFKESPFIDNMMVVGDGQKFAAAIITLDWGFLKSWWARKKMGEYPEDKMAVIEDPRVKKRIQKEVIKYNKFFGKTEQVQKYKVIADEWTPQGGELSQTLKLRRTLVEPKYKEIIDSLFV